MSHGDIEWLAGFTLLFAAFLADRILRPWRARRQAEAEERKALALITSEEMRAAFRVLTGTPADPAQGVPEVPGVGKRLARLENELKPNGGGSARDLLDKIHAVAVENAENVARVEEGQRRAATLAGEAATLAGTADDRIKALREDVREQAQRAEERHADNSNRLERLERSAYQEWQRREFYLATLKELYGIELGDPDE